MNYLGGKSRLAKHIVKRINALAPKSSGRFVSTFVGGGAVEAHVGRAGLFKQYEAGDLMPDLILMYRDLCIGWEPPFVVTDEQYFMLKNAPPSALRGFVGFGCSFAGIWFGHPAHNKYGDKIIDVKAAASARSVLKDVPGWKRFRFRHRDYREWDLHPGDVVYCDPPYKGTSGYKGVGDSGTKTNFDSEEFWRWANAHSMNGVRILVSETTATSLPGWIRVWSLDRKVGQQVSFKREGGKSKKDGGTDASDALLIHERFAREILSRDLDNENDQTIVREVDDEEDDQEEAAYEAVIKQEIAACTSVRESSSSWISSFKTEAELPLADHFIEIDGIGGDDLDALGIALAEHQAPLPSSNTAAEEITRSFSSYEGLLYCPRCHYQHIDSGGATNILTSSDGTVPHEEHKCAQCGMTWQVLPMVTGMSFVLGRKYEAPVVHQHEDDKDIW